MNARELHHRAVAEFDQRVDAVSNDQWNADTLLPGWDVRTLVNHLVSENRWTPPIMAGQRVEDVGDRFEGDLLGDDPRGAWKDSAREATAAVTDEAMDRIVHLSFGDLPGREYAMQLFADHLIHAWDLARAVGADDRLDPELVEACADWFSSVEDLYRQGGAIGPRVELGPDADAQTVLLGRFGRVA